MLDDLRDALRQLKKSPGFTATAVITLALGIGATTAIFTLVHKVMLKSLPVANPDELYRIGDKVRCCNWGGYTQGEDGDFSLFSWEAYKNFRDHTPEFTDLAALQAGNAPLGVRRAGALAQADTRNGEYVSGNFFRTMGVQPWIGRLLTSDDDREGAPSVAVMSYRIWQQKYGSDPSVVGAGYQINGHPFTVIGVGPPGFYGAKLAGWGMPDFWLPLSTEPLIDGDTARLKAPNRNFLDILGRVKPGTNPKELEAKLRVEFHGWLASHVPDMEPAEKQLWQQQTVRLVPGGGGVAAMKDQYQDGLKLLLVAAACVLLVACGNLANLMLARGLKDRAETSVRVALGASWQRLVRKALVECVTLSLIGGALGIAVAYAGTRLILYLAFQIGGRDNYVPVDAAPSWPVLLFALAVSLLTGIIFGIAPAWMASRADPVEALRGANRSVGGRGSWAQKSLVIGQAAMSLVLLSAAALLTQSLRNLQHQNFGFEPSGRYIAWINPTLGPYKPEQMEPLFRRIDERLLQIPGVRMAAPALYAPMTGDSWNDAIRIQGRPEPPAKEDTSAGWARVMPGFFEILDAKMVLGRPLTEEDTATTRKVAVVNEAFAKRFFKGQNPIGQHFGPDRIRYASNYEIVGVVRDMRYMVYEYKKPPGPMFWLPEAQSVQYDDPNFQGGEVWSHYLYNIIIWAPGNPPGMEERVRKALAGIDPDFVLYGVDPYDKVVNNDFQQQNMIATLTSLFGGLGLVLAAIGLYGVMAYTVEQRTSEIGVRMALGAARGDVVKMVLRGAFSQIGIGLALGIPAAIGAGMLMTTQLFAVKPWDPVMLVLATSMLAAAALLASYIPARRAAAVEPMVALRNE
jgi:putative ABC transport system permease protein